MILRILVSYLRISGYFLPRSSPSLQPGVGSPVISLPLYPFVRVIEKNLKESDR
jgi:hypothetical protein